MNTNFNLSQKLQAVQGKLTGPAQRTPVSCVNTTFNMSQKLDAVHHHAARDTRDAKAQEPTDSAEIVRRQQPMRAREGILQRPAGAY